MAEKAKAKGKKIGRWSRKPSNLRYNRERNKSRRILKMMRRFPKYKAPGWEQSQIHKDRLVSVNKRK